MSSLHSNATHRTLHSHDSPSTQPGAMSTTTAHTLLQSTPATAQISCRRLEHGPLVDHTTTMQPTLGTCALACRQIPAHCVCSTKYSTAHTGSSCQAVIDCSSLLLAALPHTHTPLHTQHTTSQLNDPLHQSIHPQLVSESAAAAAFEHFSIHGNHGPAKPMNGMNAQTQGGSRATKP